MTLFPPTASFSTKAPSAVDAGAGSPTVIRKAVFYGYTAATNRVSWNPKTIFSLVAGTAYTFNVQIRNMTASRAVSVGMDNPTFGSAAAKWLIKRIA